jgi:hypothetical protein
MFVLFRPVLSLFFSMFLFRFQDQDPAEGDSSQSKSPAPGATVPSGLAEALWLHWPWLHVTAARAWTKREQLLGLGEFGTLGCSKLEPSKLLLVGGLEHFLFFHILIIYDYIRNKNPN